MDGKNRISLKAARITAGYTIDQVSAELHLSKATIINYEKGRQSPRVNQFEKMCSLYGVTPSDIILPEVST